MTCIGCMLHCSPRHALYHACMQAARNTQRLFVGNLPPSAPDDDVKQLFARGLAAAGASEAPGCAVSDIFVNTDKRFAFVEFRTPTEAANALALEGVSLRGCPLSLRRPHEFSLLEVRFLCSTVTTVCDCVRPHFLNGCPTEQASRVTSSHSVPCMRSLPSMYCVQGMLFFFTHSGLRTPPIKLIVVCKFRYVVGTWGNYDGWCRLS